MSMKGKKRYNPYKIKTKEYVRFRGIMNESERANMHNAYVGGSSNLVSYKLRCLEKRSGQERKNLDPGEVHEAGSYIATRGRASGDAILCETKGVDYINRPKRFPWREITPLDPSGGIPPWDSKLTLRCKDIDVPGYMDRVEDSEEEIVDQGTFMETCFTSVCQDVWDYFDADTDNGDWGKILANASKVVNPSNIFEICYDFNGTPPPPPSYPDTPDDPPPTPQPDPICIDEVLGATFDLPNYHHLTLAEGYTAAAKSSKCTVYANVTTPGSFTNMVYFTLKLDNSLHKNHVSITDREDNYSSSFECSKSGYRSCYISVADGMPAGAIVKGSLIARVGKESAVMPILIVVGLGIFDTDDIAKIRYSTTEKDLTIPGSYPNVNSDVDPYAVTPLGDPVLSIEYSTSSQSETYHSNKTGALNIQWNTGRKSSLSMTKDIDMDEYSATFPSFSTFKTIFSWVERRAIYGSIGSAVKNLTYQQDYLSGYWFTLNGSDDQRRTYATIINTAEVIYVPRSLEVDLPIDVYELDLGSGVSTPAVPGGDPGMASPVVGISEIIGLKVTIIGEGFQS